DLQVLAEFGSWCSLHAMIGPQNLRAVRNSDRLVWAAARMRRGEREVAGRMPVLGQHDMPKARGQFVHERNDLVAARNGQAPPGAEVVLHVDNQQHVVVADGQRCGHGTTSSCGASRLSTSVASRCRTSAMRTG